MGFDLFVYTANPLTDGKDLVPLREWKHEGTGWTCGTKTWQVVVNGSEEVTHTEDRHEMAEVFRIRPSIQWRTEINVEGRQSSEALGMAYISAQRLAVRLSGVVFDPQQDVLTLPLSEGAMAALATGPPGAKG